MSTTTEEIQSETGDGLGTVVASHYNNIQERGVEARKDSRIFYLRNFNNWIKSTLIREYSSKVHEKRQKDNLRDDFNVLDLCCGKGGDLLKWQDARIDYLVCVDIAAVSVLSDAKTRYERMVSKRRNRTFKAEFLAADVTKDTLRDLYAKKDVMFDIISCQFAFHYSFESLDQAECILRNVSESLKPGGYFIGTIPNSNDLVARAMEAKSHTFGNNVYTVTFDKDELDQHISGEKPFPLFGAKYKFHLEGVVDCPEFLVHIDTLTRLASRFNLVLIGKLSFDSYFKSFREKSRDLLINMKALEPYPAKKGFELRGQDVEDNYEAAKTSLENSSKPNEQVGTLSKEEWEALTLYQTFAFKKMSC